LPVADLTASNLNARRLATLSRLSASALRQPTVAAACAAAARALAENRSDVPFAALYLLDLQAGVARLAETVNLERARAPFVPSVDPSTADTGPFPVARVFRSGCAETIALDHADGLPVGLANQPVAEALCLPLTVPGYAQPLGVLVVGANPTRRLHHPEYRAFFDLVAGQFAAAIQNASVAEEERRRAEMLAELDPAKTTFFANVSHEFRTPLTLMLGPLEDVLADAASPLAPGQRERLQLVQRNALRLEKLVNTLLEFARTQSGRVQAAFAEVDLAALTADLASGFRSVVEGAGLSLRVDCGAALTAQVDVGMWEKIVLNLVSNAFKFTFDGGIEVTLGRQGQEAVLAVRDTGIGIGSEHLDKVFERFHRVLGARSRTHEGSGIGLALVRDLVELHRGGISVDSAPGRGSTFTVRLPLRRPELADAPAAPNAASARALAAYAGEAARWLPAAGEQAAPRDGAAGAAPVAGTRWWRWPIRPPRSSCRKASRRRWRCSTSACPA
jgi:signal transduction histidine kinase